MTARGVRVMSWTPEKRTLRIGAGPATYVQVAQNFNSGWTATLGGRTLKAVSLSGWEQGWIVPAGVSGVITMKFEPDQTYRAALLIGGLFLLALFILAIAKGDQSGSRPIGPREEASRNYFGRGSGPWSLLHRWPFGIATRPPCCHYIPLGKQRHRGDRGCEL